MDKLKELRQKLGELTKKARAINDKVIEEGRAYTSEEEQEWQRLNEDITNTEEEIRALETAEKRKAEIEGREEYLRGREHEPTRPDPNDSASSFDPELEQRFLGRILERVGSYEAGQGEFTRNGYRRSTLEYVEQLRQAQNPLVSREYREAFNTYIRDGRGGLTPEHIRALSAGTATEGGHTVEQERFLPELIKSVDNRVPIRGLSRVIQLTDAASLGAPALDSDPSDPDWTTELSVGTEDTTMDFKKRELQPHPLAKYIKVSKKLLRVSALDIAMLVAQRLGYKVGIAEDTAFNTGDGASKPLGIFTASASGISTSRDVNVGDGSGGIDPDKMITARHTLRDGYRATWVWHRNVLAALRKLRHSAGAGAYMWQPSLAAGIPAVFLDFPYVTCEQSPGTVAAGNYVAVLGDFSYYWIVEALNMELQRLEELFALANQAGWIIRAEVDAQPVLEDAFVRCKIDA